ncbi:MAG: hypothetical protein JNK99_12480, partial [Candidatus Accumulibacter sp.]|nr:hypothetical protein [Accumulibacter sp.]
MQIRTSPSTLCLALLLAGLPIPSAQAADTLPKSRDALFADDEPVAPRQSGSREALFADDPPDAAELPASRESLFGEKDPPPPLTAPASESSPPSATTVKGFVENVMAYAWPKPSHWSEMMTHLDVSAQGSISSNIKWKLGARIDYDAVYSLTDFYPQAVENNQRFNFLLRENYLDIGAGNWDFRLGRQQVIWGEMVGLFF